MFFHSTSRFLTISHSSAPSSIADEQTYAWRPPDAPAESTCYFDVGELVRLRVESEEWHDHAPTGPTQSQKAKERLQQQRDLHRRSGGGQNGDVEVSAEMAEEADRRAPYVVIVSQPSVLSLILFEVPELYH